jgi:hypothetical protein
MEYVRPDVTKRGNVWRRNDFQVPKIIEPPTKKAILILFTFAIISSYLKTVHVFSISPHLGPLQISLGRIIIDIIKFFFIYMLVLVAFGCGNQRNGKLISN